jgi:hypothetical protein
MSEVLPTFGSSVLVPLYRKATNGGNDGGPPMPCSIVFVRGWPVGLYKYGKNSSTTTRQLLNASHASRRRRAPRALMTSPGVPYVKESTENAAVGR